MKKLASFVFRLLISLGLLVYLLKRTDFGALKEAFLAYSPLWWLVGFLVYIAFQALSVRRWQYICRALGFEQNYSYFARLYLINMYFNTLLPGLMGGDVIRSYYLAKDGFGLKEGSFSVILDRGAGLFGLCFILLWALPLWGDFLPSRVYVFILLSALGIILGGIAVSLVATFRGEKLLSPLKWPTSLGLFAYGFSVQILYVLQFAVMARGLDLFVSFKDFLVLVPVTGFLASLPISLGGLGVREASLVYFLGLKGIPREKGLLLGFLIYSTVLVGAIPGGILYLKGRVRD